MANPTAPVEGGGLTLDLITDSAGSARLKLAVGSNSVAGASTVGGHQAVATHQHTQGSFALGQPVVTTAGVDSSSVVRASAADTDGVTATRVRGAIGSFVTTEVSLSSNVRSALPPSPLSGRRSFIAQADSGNAVSVYVGDSGVTVAEGVELAAGISIGADSETAVLYAIAPGAAKVRVLEVS